MVNGIGTTHLYYLYSVPVYLCNAVQSVQSVQSLCTLLLYRTVMLCVCNTLWRGAVRCGAVQLYTQRRSNFCNISAFALSLSLFLSLSRELKCIVPGTAQLSSRRLLLQPFSSLSPVSSLESRPLELAIAF